LQGAYPSKDIERAHPAVLAVSHCRDLFAGYCISTDISAGVIACFNSLAKSAHLEVFERLASPFFTCLL